MDVGSFSIERIALLVWCILTIFTDMIDYFPYDFEMKLGAVAMLAVLSLIAVLESQQ